MSEKYWDEVLIANDTKTQNNLKERVSENIKMIICR